MTHFEVHRLTDDRWLLDAVYDDRVAAIAEARSLMARARTLAAVRVLKVEEHDAGFVEWTVYARDPAHAPLYTQRLVPPLAPFARRPRRFPRARRRFLRPASPTVPLTVLLALGAMLVLIFQWLEPRDTWLFDRPEARQPHTLINPWTGEASR